MPGTEKVVEETPTSLYGWRIEHDLGASGRLGLEDIDEFSIRTLGASVKKMKTIHPRTEVGENRRKGMKIAHPKTEMAVAQ